MGCGGRSRSQEGLGGGSAEGIDPNRRSVRHHTIGRVDLADNASVQLGKDNPYRHDRVIEIERTLGDERGLQSLGGVVVAVIKRGASVGERVVVIGSLIHDMAVGDSLPRHRIVHVHSRQHREPQHRRRCAEGCRDREVLALQQDPQYTGQVGRGVKNANRRADTDSGTAGPS